MIRKVRLIALVLLVAVLFTGVAFSYGSDAIDPDYDKFTKTLTIDGEILQVYTSKTTMEAGHSYYFDDDFSDIQLPSDAGNVAPVVVFIKVGKSVTFLPSSDSPSDKLSILAYGVESYEPAVVPADPAAASTEPGSGTNEPAAASSEPAQAVEPKPGKIVLTGKGGDKFYQDSNNKVLYTYKDGTTTLKVVTDSLVKKSQSWEAYSESDIIVNPSSNVLSVYADADKGVLATSSAAFEELREKSYDMFGTHGTLTAIGNGCNITMSKFTGIVESKTSDDSGIKCKIDLKDYTGKILIDSNGLILPSDWSEGRVEYISTSLGALSLSDIALPESGTLDLGKTITSIISSNITLPEEFMIINEGRLTISEGAVVTVDGRIHTTSYSQNNIYGDIVVNGTSTSTFRGNTALKGTLTNSGTMQFMSGLTIEGALVNTGVLYLSGEIINKGQLTNDGDGHMEVSNGFQNKGMITLRSDNGFTTEEGSYPLYKNAYNNITGKVILDAAGKILGFTTTSSAISIGNLSEPSFVGGMYICCRDGNVKYVTVTNVTFDTTGLLITCAQSALVRNCTFGTMDDPIMPCRVSDVLGPVCKSCIGMVYYSDGAFGIENTAERVNIRDNTVDMEAVWYNHDGTLLLTGSNVYTGILPVHPEGLYFNGWEQSVGDDGSIVMTAKFGTEPLDDVGGDDGLCDDPVSGGTDDNARMIAVVVSIIVLVGALGFVLIRKH